MAITLAQLDAEREEVRRALADDSYRIPRGWYRAHRAIAAGECAHCRGRFRPGARIGYNSILPGRHKVLCGACFIGEPASAAPSPRRPSSAQRRRAAEGSRGGMFGTMNRERATAYARAEYFVWEARRGFVPAGNDPATGRPWDSWRDAHRAIGRASHAGAARACYALARRWPNPLARMGAAGA
jgi:hypothetical protein